MEVFAPMQGQGSGSRCWRMPALLAAFGKRILGQPSYDPAVAQLNDPLPVRRIFLRMRHLDDCHSLFIQSSKQLHDFFALAGMQISSWLIRQQQFGRGNDSAGYPDELLLAAGELPRIQILFADDLKTIERVRHQRSPFALTIMPIREWNIEVLVNRQIVEQMILLENESDLVISQSGPLFCLQKMHRGLIEKIFPRPSVIVHAENVQESPFARP